MSRQAIGNNSVKRLSTHRIRFSLRGLLLATAIVALLVAYLVSPYLNERRSRLVTLAMEKSGIGFNTESINVMLLDAGLMAPADRVRPEEAPMWFQPLMRDLPVSSAAIREIWLWDDGQVHAAKDFYASLPNLQTVYVWGRYKYGPNQGRPGVTADGLQELARSLPSIDRLVLTDVPVTGDCCRFFSGVRVLSVRAQAADSPLLNRPHTQLDDILSTPGLEVLMTNVPLDLGDTDLSSPHPTLNAMWLSDAGLEDTVVKKIQSANPRLGLRLDGVDITNSTGG